MSKKRSIWKRVSKRNSYCNSKINVKISGYKSKKDQTMCTLKLWNTEKIIKIMQVEWNIDSLYNQSLYFNVSEELI